MPQDAVVESEAEQTAEVMASVEDGPVDRFVIADISTDDAYITLALDDAATLPAWL